MKKLKSIQVLRALAALMVTIAHASEEAKYYFHFAPWLETAPLGKGVDLFFVISGFIIYYSSLNLFGTTGAVKRFALNRFIRVVPMYYIFTTLMIMVVVLVPAGVKEARFDVAQIVSSYAFIPYARYDGRIAPILSLGWTLNYEIFFYAIFASVMWLPARRAAWTAITLLVALVAAGFFLKGTDSSIVRAWTDNIILEFGAGVVIAMVYERWGKALSIGAWASLLIFAAALVVMYVLNLPHLFEHKPPRFITAGVPAAIAVFSAVILLPEAWELRLPGWLSALGDSSYSLYLSHRFVQRPLQIVAHRLPDIPFMGAVYLVIAVATAVAVGHIVYVLLETPLLNALRRRLQPRNPMGASRRLQERECATEASNEP